MKIDLHTDEKDRCSTTNPDVQELTVRIPGEITMPGEFQDRLNDVTSDAFKEKEAEMCGEVQQAVYSAFHILSECNPPKVVLLSAKN